MIRLDSNTRVEWYCKADCPDTLIPPMIFLTFVENAFKYGASTSKECIISISLTLTDGLLVFATSNRIMRHREEFNSDMHIGLVNCRNRLAGLFPGTHTLSTEESDGTFTVILKINLN